MTDAGDVVGTVVEPRLFAAVLEREGHARGHRRGRHGGAPAFALRDEPVAAATRMLTSGHALLVEEKGRTIGILTRIDVIGFASR